MGHSLVPCIDSCCVYVIGKRACNGLEFGRPVQA